MDEFKKGKEKNKRREAFAWSRDGREMVDVE